MSMDLSDLDPEPCRFWGCRQQCRCLTKAGQWLNVAAVPTVLAFGW
jgi:hypothetical protein